MPTILHEAVTPVAVSVQWSDVAQNIVNQVISAFNDVAPIALTLLGISIAFKTTVRLVKRFARI
jgi:ribosome maturation protein Sdo1